MIKWVKKKHGPMPEWLMGADCKSAGYAYVGSNPTRPKNTKYIVWKFEFFFFISFFWIFCHKNRTIFYFFLIQQKSYSFFYFYFFKKKKFFFPFLKRKFFMFEQNIKKLDKKFFWKKIQKNWTNKSFQIMVLSKDSKFYFF